MKPNKTLSICSIIPIFVLIIFFTSCAAQQTARVTINLGSSGLATAGKTSGYAERIIDILSLSTNAYAAAPSNITLYILTVTGPDGTNFMRYYPPNVTQIIVDIPAGKQREIALTAKINPSDTRAVLEYRGSAIVDLKAGETRDIAITMLTAETKIVIPDYKRNRVIQIDNMAGSNWSEISIGTISGINLTGNMYPTDVAFDGQGRIYVANNTNTATDAAIFRIDSIPVSGTAAAQLILSGTAALATNVQWVAIDMKKQVLYYATSSAVYNAGIAGNGVKPAVSITAGSIYGINVDDDGMLYIAYTNGGGTNIVAKYDPSNFATAAATFDFSAHYPSATLVYRPTDVVVKSKRVFVCTSGYNTAWTLGSGLDIPSSEIVELDSNLQFVGSYGKGVNPNADTAPGHFYGPSHFVATLNRKICLLDDGKSGGGYCNDYVDKLVSMDDIKGTNWEAYGTGGFGVGQFGFYYGC